jgi:sensor c-di-GMP phosphodiesterase-like protein
MRGLTRAFTRRNLVAVAVGVLLGGALLFALEAWIASRIERQARLEVDIGGRRALALAEARVDAAVDVVNRISVKGVSCASPHQQILRRAIWEAAPVKQVGFLTRDGRVACAEPELPIALKDARPALAAPQMQGIWLDQVTLADGQSMLRVRRTGGAIEPFALLPSTLLLPQVGVDGSALRAYAAVLGQHDAVIAHAGERPPAAEAQIRSIARSRRNGFSVEVIAPRSMLPAANDRLRWLELMVAGLATVAIGSMFAVVVRQRPTDPVAILAAALKAGEFVPYYQPIVDIRSGQLRGAEVLVRRRLPDGSLELPGSFIPLMESSGLIRDLTRDLMRRVCREAGEAIGSRPGLKISFNFAARLFRDEQIVKDVRSIFVSSPIPLSQVVLEVTERDSIENFAEARQTIAALQALGVRIAIDDVGTGHSGLSYMLKLGVDIIKIDKMFVDAIGSDRNSTTIVETLVDLAHNMRMDVVAEGVENFEQVMHLREVGIRSAQGYAFAPPLPGSAFLELVQAIDPGQTAEAAAA